MRTEGIRWLLPLRGRRVFSTAAWAVIAPFAVLATGGFELAAGPGDLARGAAIAVLAQLAVGAVFLVANTLERRARSDASHLVLIASAFAVLAVGRPALISAVQDATGGPLLGDQPFGLRVLTNLLTIAVPTLLVFFLDQSLRRGRDVRARLGEVAAHRAAQAVHDEAATARLVARLRTDAIDPVLRALDGARVTPFDAAAQAETLRRVAHDVVRPLSHTASRAEADDPGEPPEDPSALPRPQVSSRPRMRNPPAWAAPVGLLLLTATAIATEYRVTAGLVAIAALGVGVGLSSLAGRIPVRRMPRAHGIAVVAVVQLAIGLAMTAVLLLPAPFATRPVYWITTPAAFAAIGLVVGLTSATLERLAEDERALSQLVVGVDRHASATRANLRDLADRVGRVLHTEVQGRIVATTLRLRMGTAGPETVDELRAAVEADLDDAVEPVPAVRGSAPELLARTIETWAAAMPLEASADEDALAWIAAAPSRSQLMLDAVSEALSNAVRHGDDGEVRIELARTDGGVRLAVRSAGRLQRGGDGIGLRLLVERGAAVALDSEPPSTVVLTVDLGEEIGAVGAEPSQSSAPTARQLQSR